MIVRDGAHRIDRALQSVAPHVDRMVVVDTGSLDATMDVAASAGAHVLQFPWCDDFSAARNYALSATGAAWNVVIDCDEELVDGTGLREVVRRLPYGSVGNIEVLSTIGQDAGRSEVREWQPRILPAGCRYAGRIHEQVDAGFSRLRTPLRLVHAGYTASERATKRGRNERLIRLELQREPGDAYLHFQLSRALESEERWDEAASAGLAALDLGLAGRFVHELAARLLHCLGRAGRFEEARSVGRWALQRFPESPDVHFALGDLALDAALTAGQPDPALLDLIEVAWRACVRIGERPDLIGAIPGRGSWMAAHNLAAFHDLLGSPGEARRFAELERRAREMMGKTTAVPDEVAVRRIAPAPAGQAGWLS